MNIPENSYCRLCAEIKSLDKQINLHNDNIKYQQITERLSFLNAEYVDLRCNVLPKTVCFVCYETLNKSYEFFDNVKKAQLLLTNLLLSTQSTNQITADTNDPDTKQWLTDIKIDKSEIPDDNLNNQLLANIAEQSYTDFSVDVKAEENEDDKISLTEDDDDDLGTISDETLNVEEILDAALHNKLINSKIQIYGKEVKRKGDCKTWSDYPWMCSYCKMEFEDLDTLRTHSKLTHAKCAAYSCNDCTEYVRRRGFEYFVKHVKSHRYKLRKCCHLCNELFHDEGSLKLHLRLHRLELYCKFCAERFDYHNQLEAHLETYKDEPKKRRKKGAPITLEDLTCKVCNNVYKSLNGLRDHMNKQHCPEKRRNYTCDRCGKTYLSKGSLTSHIMAHDKIRPHACRICNKTFLFPNQLRRHVEMHSSVKPFSCEQCGRCFRRKYQLNAHKIVHTDNMPFTCQFCNKAFRFKQLMINHERQHTGQRPYSCQFCTMEFTNWSNYNKHTKRRHGTDNSRKKITPEGVFPVNPETGQIIQMDHNATEEWKRAIMKPCKRGKKKMKLA